MSPTIETHSSRLELDKAFRYAVTLAWEDLMKPIEPRSIRVEYVCEPGTVLDHLSVWSVRAGGYQDLVCDFWTWASFAHPSGAHFGDRHSSDALAQALLFVMGNQDQFTRPTDAGRHGLVLIYPPDADDRIEALAWMKGVQSLEDEASSGEAPRLEKQRQNQGEEVSSRTDEQGHPYEPAATVSDATGYSGCEPAEAPPRTSAGDYFALRYAWPE